jgi:hypothetical protein
MTSTKAKRQEIARRVRDKILTDPESHQQESWALIDPADVLKKGVQKGKYTAVQCNSTGCVCGWASMLSGDWAIITDDGLTDEFVLPGEDELTELYSIQFIITEDGREMNIEDRGKELLGLLDSEKDWLFSPARDRLEVLYALNEIIQGGQISYSSRGHLKRTLTQERIAEIVTPPTKPATKATEVIDLSDLIHDEERVEQGIEA